MTLLEQVRELKKKYGFITIPFICRKFKITSDIAERMMNEIKKSTEKSTNQ